MSTVNKKKATIKRASKAARDNATKLDTEAMQWLKILYSEMAHYVEEVIRGTSDENTLTLAQLGLLKQKLTTGLSRLYEALTEALDGYLRRAAALGAEVMRGFVEPMRLAEHLDRAVLTTRSFIASDGLQLSERLWRLNDGANDAVIKHVERAVTLGQSASEATRDFLSRQDPVPATVRKHLSDANPERLARTAAENLMTGKMNPYDQAKRVFRTEINRAHGLAYQNAVFDDDEVAGTRFLLSPHHKVKDICDMHASVNRYGLGKGVYPKGKSPWPAHPNTLSYEVVVFNDEVSQEDKQSETRIEWLNQQSEELQIRVLNSRAKQKALMAGVLTERQIQTPWKTLKIYYQRKGIDLDFLRVDN